MPEPGARKALPGLRGVEARPPRAAASPCGACPSRRRARRRAPSPRRSRGTPPWDRRPARPSPDPPSARDHEVVLHDRRALERSARRHELLLALRIVREQHVRVALGAHAQRRAAAHCDHLHAIPVRSRNTGSSASRVRCPARWSWSRAGAWRPRLPTVRCEREHGEGEAMRSRRMRTESSSAPTSRRSRRIRHEP
jgi:hypothetical protein